MMIRLWPNVAQILLWLSWMTGIMLNVSMLSFSNMWHGRGESAQKSISRLFLVNRLGPALWLLCLIGLAERASTFESVPVSFWVVLLMQSAFLLVQVCQDKPMLGETLVSSRRLGCWFLLNTLWVGPVLGTYGPYAMLSSPDVSTERRVLLAASLPGALILFIHSLYSLYTARSKRSDLFALFRSKRPSSTELFSIVPGDWTRLVPETSLALSTCAWSYLAFLATGHVSCFAYSIVSTCASIATQLSLESFYSTKYPRTMELYKSCVPFWFSHEARV